MLDQVSHVLAAQCRHNGSPRALVILDLLRRGQWAELLKLRIDPSDYTDPMAYKADALVTELLRKCQIDAFKSRDEMESDAVQTFLDCEAQCFATNSRLDRFIDNQGPFDPKDEAVIQFIAEWRKEIKRVLGALPDADLVPRFSGGATVSDVGRLTTLPDKMTGVPTIYPSAEPLLSGFWSSLWGRNRLRYDGGRLERVRSNVFFTVPKSAEKRRGCAKEASLAVSLQLAAAQIIRPRLKAKLGIDLATGKEKHMELARHAVALGLATKDLSNASNTVAKKLVKLVLPADWFALLDSLRAPFVCITHGGVVKTLRLEMFSSMGNGFTFELETLLFATLVRTVCTINGACPELVHVFGDDIICPAEVSDEIDAVLRWSGFLLNSEKSYSVGPFRESCGGDYFNGVDVRAHYLEKLPTEPADWIALRNGLRRRGFCGKSLALCESNLPSALRTLRGPEELGDLVLTDDESRWKVKLIDGVPHVRTWSPVATLLPYHHWRPEVVLASALLGSDSSGVAPRQQPGDIRSFKERWTPVPPRLTERGAIAYRKVDSFVELGSRGGRVTRSSFISTELEL